MKQYHPGSFITFPAWRRHRASSCAILLLLALSATSLYAKKDTDPTFTRIVGEVNVKAIDAANWIKAEVETPLGAGDTVKTGYRSKAEIKTPSGLIRLYENTVLMVPREEPADMGMPEFILKLGAGIFDTAGTSGPQVSVVTNQIVVGIRTARATVVAGADGSTIAAHAGKVTVTETAASPVAPKELPEGWMFTVKQVETRRDGTVIRHPGRMNRFEEKDAWERWERENSPELPSNPSISPGLPF